MAEMRYHEPDWFTTHVLNPLVQNLTKAGISVMGSRQLRVRGRKSGEWRTTPVNLMTIDGVQYLVSPRGQTQWVRNLRVIGSGELRLGRKVQSFSATELGNDAKAPVLKHYLEKWSWEVGQFFEGVDKNASDAQLAEIAPGFPVFRLS